jgi:2-keto-3-deoxy-L-rhamnonate aldolase RhmA
MRHVDDRTVVDAIEHVTKTCLAARVPLGYFGVTVEAVRPYIERGYTLIVAGVDTVLLGTAAKTLLTDLRRTSGTIVV